MKPSAQPRVTLREIARRLDISHTTVSRALHDDRRITEAVRREVQRVAKKMGYQPDPMLAALAHYSRGIAKHPVTAALAWINTWPEPERLRSYREFDLYWQGASTEAARNGYHLDELDCPKDFSPARLHEVLRARGIRGILLPPGWRGKVPDWDDFDWNDFCIVRFGYSLETPPSHLVTADQLSNGLLAFERMRQRGYRRIGMVVWKTQGTRLVRFSAGYLYGQLQVPARFRLPLMMMNEIDPEADERRLLEWLKKTRPDAILTDIPILPKLLAKAGCQVPQDLGLATLSVLDGGISAGIYQNSDEIGTAAVQLLISLIHHNQRGIPEIPREVLIRGRWVDGKTLPSKNAI
jgi:DNA-binding LacI/PurR family transcriptional regulator